MIQTDTQTDIQTHRNRHTQEQGHTETYKEINKEKENQTASDRCIEKEMAKHRRTDYKLKIIYQSATSTYEIAIKRPLCQTI